MSNTLHKFGWIPDLPDHRDLHLALKPLRITDLPPKVDLSITPSMPPVYDQGNLGSCTANAIGAAFEFEQKKQDNTKDFPPSRLFIYYNERVMEGTPFTDSGAMIRDGVKSVAKLGVCPETEWPYDISKFTIPPSLNCYIDAQKHQALQYMRVIQTQDQMMSCLADGYPIIFGATLYESFESPSVAKTGIVPMPSSNESVIGGHAILACGYDTSDNTFLVRNSWGTNWGINGYCKFPMAYLTNNSLCDDLWTIRLVE